LKKDEAQRLKALEQQNGRLKKIVAEQALDISLLKDLQRGKLVSPARRRDAVRFLVKRRRISGRRACRVVGQHRSSQRYRRLEPEYERRLVARIYELAAAHPRYGYRRIWALLRGEGFRVNRKRIERLWRLGGQPGAAPQRPRRAGARRKVRPPMRPGTWPPQAPTRFGRTTSRPPAPARVLCCGS
jgi:putative transposase